MGAAPPSELRRAAQHNPQLVVTGFVGDARPFFQEATVYICPIFTGGGTRLKVLDALAMAKPLVATEFTVEGLDLKAGRHYLQANHEDQFVHQVETLENQPNLARRLCTAGRKRVTEEYSWDVVAARLLQAYEAAATAPH